MWGNRPTAPPPLAAEAAAAAAAPLEVGVDDIEAGRWGGSGGAPEEEEVGEDTGGGEGEEDAAPTAGPGVPNPAIFRGDEGATVRELGL